MKESDLYQALNVGVNPHTVTALPDHDHDGLHRVIEQLTAERDRMRSLFRAADLQRGRDLEVELAQARQEIAQLKSHLADMTDTKEAYELGMVQAVELKDMAWEEVEQRTKERDQARQELADVRSQLAAAIAAVVNRFD